MRVLYNKGSSTIKYNIIKYFKAFVDGSAWKVIVSKALTHFWTQSRKYLEANTEVKDVFIKIKS